MSQEAGNLVSRTLYNVMAVNGDKIHTCIGPENVFFLKIVRDDRHDRYDKNSNVNS